MNKHGSIKAYKEKVKETKDMMKHEGCLTKIGLHEIIEYQRRKILENIHEIIQKLFSEDEIMGSNQRMECYTNLLSELTHLVSGVYGQIEPTYIILGLAMIEKKRAEGFWSKDDRSQYSFFKKQLLNYDEKEIDSSFAFSSVQFHPFVSKYDLHITSVDGENIRLTSDDTRGVFSLELSSDGFYAGFFTHVNLICIDAELEYPALIKGDRTTADYDWSKEFSLNKGSFPKYFCKTDPDFRSLVQYESDFVNTEDLAGDSEEKIDFLIKCYEAGVGEDFELFATSRLFCALHRNESIKRERCKVKNLKKYIDEIPHDYQIVIVGVVASHNTTGLINNFCVHSFYNDEEGRIVEIVTSFVTRPAIKRHRTLKTIRRNICQKD